MGKNTKRNTCTVLFCLSVAGAAQASSNDEIQVYDDSINKPGEWGLEMHTNYVASGKTTPEWPGDAPSNHSFRVTPELSYGLTGTIELGAYLPMLRTADNTSYVEGGKIRAKYIPAHGESPYYWGINGELGRTSLRSNPENWNFELRPIFGYRIDKWHLTANPVLDFALEGQHSGIPGFAPSFKAGYALKEDLSIGLEHYADLGKVNGILPGGQQTHNTYVAIDTAIIGHGVNFGIGRGTTSNSDKWTIKAIIEFPLPAK